MVKTIYLRPVMSDDKMKEHEGENFNNSYYNTIIDYDCDCYGYEEENSKKNPQLLFKFRKKIIEKKFTDLALQSFLELSKKKHDNRGAAAGKLNKDALPNYVNILVNENGFRSKFLKSNGELSKTLTSNLSKSNVAGFLDKADRNLKGKGETCRETAFNRDNPELWKNALSFLKKCDSIFKQLEPTKYNLQRTAADLSPDFVIPGTAFSTVTINYSWRTGMHKDTGDFEDGFGNLIVIEDPYNKNTYKGCYLGFPRFKVCVDVKTGDFLGMNVHEWHCNTEFIGTSKTIYGNFSDIDIKNNWYFNRMSIVLYLRKKMINCKMKKMIGGSNNNNIFESYLNNQISQKQLYFYLNYNNLKFD